MMLDKINIAFTKFVFSIFHLISFKGKNEFGAGFFVFSFISGMGAYLCFNPPYSNYGCGLLIGLAGRSAMGWIQIAVSVLLMLLGFIATYKAFWPKKPIDYEQYLYPISKSNYKEE
jgi:hypothetical protein